MVSGIQQYFLLALFEHSVEADVPIERVDFKCLSHLMGDKKVCNEVGRIQWAQVNQALDLPTNVYHDARLYANRHYDNIVSFYKEITPIVTDLRRMLSIEKVLRANKIDIFKLDDSELSNKYREKYLNAFINISMCIRMTPLGKKYASLYLDRYELI